MSFVVFFFCILHRSQSFREALIIPSTPKANSLTYIHKAGPSNYSIHAGNRSSCRFQTSAIPCECLLAVSDSYLLENNGIQIAAFSVGPPDVQILVPSEHELLRELNVMLTSKLCIAEMFRIELRHRAFEVLPSENWRVVETSSVLLHSSSVNVTFPCENFVNAGYYHVRLLSSHGYNIEHDNSIFVNDSASFSLQLRNDSIFPHCVKDFSLQWQTAKCDKATLNYHIRVLALQEGESHHGHRSHYIEDIGLSPEQSLLEIGCFFFDIFYEKYCFELVSVEATSAAFHLWRWSCVNTEPVARSDSKWTSWSAWSECSATCGESVQKRHRYCEDLKLNRDNNCKGDIVQTKACIKEKCPVFKITSSGSEVIFPTLQYCACGCEMTGKSGTFFATAADSESCDGNQTWSMPVMNDYTISDFKITADLGVAGKLFFFVGAPYEELVWFSGSNQENDFTLSVNRPIFVVLWYKGNSTDLEPTNGFSISYSRRESTQQIPISTTSCDPFCTETVAIVTLAVIFILVVFLPPFVCCAVTQKIHLHNDQPLVNNLCDEEMVRSGNTECTHVSGSKPVVARRNVGIQLSVQNTPRLTSSRMPTSSPFPHGASSTSDELEYDYYDGTTLPGSLLAPLDDHFPSEIDINQIIGRSFLFSDVNDK
ncbi:hypothetical protein Q1695_001658 [Nippostrongylus brasiliensis]|nr:hypothetical protein Q1695_001658 [Nippostrongylus brasiliensis]